MYPILKIKSDRSSIIKAMVDNLDFQMLYFVGLSPQMKVVKKPDITYVYSNELDNTFNYVVKSHFTENVQKNVKEIVHFYRESGLPFSWWTSPLDRPQNLQSFLQNEGVNLLEDDPGMILDIDKIKVDKLKLTYRRVLTKTELDEFARINIEAGESPLFYQVVFQYALDELRSGKAPFEIYLGYKDGVPVTSGLIMKHAGVIGIYYVATVPQERGQGYASEIMKVLCIRGQTLGYHLATLQASKHGVSMYKKLGFEEYCMFQEFGE
jgi:GNAT superfamily N-acetyltransferase